MTAASRLRSISKLLSPGDMAGSPGHPRAGVCPHIGAPHLASTIGDPTYKEEKEGMSGQKYGKYVVTEPKFLTEMAHHNYSQVSQVSGFTFPDEVYIDKDLIKEANQWLNIAWVWGKTTPRELPGRHSHPFAEIVLLIGSDPRNLRDLGGKVEWTMGDGDGAETFVLTSTTAIYIPKWLPHGPLVFDHVERPILTVYMGLNTGGYV